MLRRMLNNNKIESIITIEDCIDIAKIHKESINKGFLSSFGDKFLSKLYHGINNDKNSRIFAYKVEDKIVGFVCGTTTLIPAYKYLMKHQLFSTIKILIPKLISITVIKRVLETCLYPFKKIKRDDGQELPSAELLSIAVIPEYRGKGISDKLYKELLCYFSALGIDKMKIIVGSQLLSAQQFYEKMGAEEVSEIEVHKGEKSKVYIHEIKKSI